MGIRKKFLEKVLVRRVDLCETPLLSTPSEGSVILSVEGLPVEKRFIECFICDDDVLKFKQGETTRVELHLLNWSWKNKRQDKKEKEIKYIKKTPVAVNAYILTGEILDIFESKYEDSHNAIIDCDIYIRLRILKDQNFKIGDYIQAEGRLDAFKVDVMEGCE